MKTEELVQEIPLPKLDSEAVRNVLNVHDDQPIEPFDFEIPNRSALYALAGYGDGVVAIDESLHYDLAFHAWE